MVRPYYFSTDHTMPSHFSLEILGVHTESGAISPSPVQWSN